MRFGDLTAKNQSNTRPARFRRKEGNEQVRRIGQARAIINNPNIEVSAFSGPAYMNRAAGFQRRVCRISNQVDQQLLQLVGIGRYDHVGTL